MLAQNNNDGKEVALYYLSQMLVGVEHKYKPIEKAMTLFTVKYIISSVSDKATESIDDEGQFFEWSVS